MFYKCLLYSFSILLSNNLLAQLQKTDTTNQLNEIVVTTKIQQKNISIARAIENIVVDKQISKGINTMQGLLNTASGVYMVDMGNEQHAMSIRLPINYSPLYNYLENGIPIRPVGIFNNNEILELNRFSLQKIELLKGPFSSGYGAQSIGAAVNFVQKKYENSKNQISLQSNGFGQWETVLNIKNNIGKWKLYANTNYTQRRVKTEYHFNYQKYAHSLRLERVFNTKNSITLQHNLVNYSGDQRDGYDSASFYTKNYKSFDKFSDRKTLAIRNSFNWNYKITNQHNLNVTLFNRIINEKQNPFYLISFDYTNPNTTKATGQITKDKFTSYGLILDYSATSKNNKLKFNQNLFLDFTPQNKYTSNFINVSRINRVNVSFTNPDSLLTNYKASLKNIALSSSVQYSPLGKVIIFAGVRADLLSYKFTNYLNSNAYSGAPSGKNQYFSISPEVSFLYKISNTQSVFVQYGSGFSPPTLSNLYRGVSTPTLAPAKYFNTEMGYKLINKNTSAQLSLYNMNGIDEFVSVIRNTGVVDVINAGKTNHKGIELQVQQNFKTFEIVFAPNVQKHIFKSYSDYGIKYDGNKINGAPSYLHNFSLTYNFPKFYNLKLTTDWFKVGPYQINAANTSQYEGYNLIGLKATIVLNNIFINIGINNVLNTTYATNADGTYGIRYYPGLPRTLQTGLSYSF